MPCITYMKRLKVLICDDSAFFRVTLRKIVESDPGFYVIDTARNGAEALDKTIRLRPDVITLDLHMPLADGLTTLKEIVGLQIAPVIVLASPTNTAPHETIDAMDAGAFDIFFKPYQTETLVNYSTMILQKLKLAAAGHIYTCIKNRKKATGFEKTTKPRKRPSPAQPVHKPAITVDLPGFKAVALGLSTGGPKSIYNVLPYLPADLNAALFVIQHMPPAFILPFTRRLESQTHLCCVETRSGMKIERGVIYVARGGCHLKLTRRPDGDIIIHHPKTPSHLFMPSIDIAMDSIFDVFGTKTIAVLMTGMGRDGVDAMLRIHQEGGYTIAESEETAIVYGMPKEAVRLGAAHEVLPDREIASQIIKAVGNNC